MSAMSGMSIQIQGLKEDLKTIQSVNPKLRREIGKDFRRVAKPTVDKINQAKSPIKDLRGFDHNGRTGARKLKAVKVDINTRRARRRAQAMSGATYETLSTIRIRTYDAPTALADMAGKVGKYQTSGRSRPYQGRPEGHALVGQGENLVRKLDSQLGHQASRFMWPSAEVELPAMESELRDIVKRVEKEANMILMKVRR